MNIHINKFIKEQKASAVIEYTIVMPIVFFAVFTLIFMGYIEYQKSVMEAAVYRGALKASKMIANPHYVDIIKEDNSNNPDVSTYDLEISPDKYYDNKPYRYLNPNLDDNVSSVKEDVAKYIGNYKMFEDNFTNNTGIQIDVKTSNFFLYQTVDVSASQSYSVPIAFGAFKPQVMDINAQAEVVVSDGAEFIRNTDLAVQLAMSISDNLGIPKRLDKVKEFINAIKQK